MWESIFVIEEINEFLLLRIVAVFQGCYEMMQSHLPDKVPMPIELSNQASVAINILYDLISQMLIIKPTNVSESVVVEVLFVYVSGYYGEPT